ncbi:MAG: N-acetylmuramoyl-L-alanine amidase [Clostridiales bacterium]|nr:N-acetylmuramoyl-L-alanine amidase [Clostridiales bacterium]
MKRQKKLLAGILALSMMISAIPVYASDAQTADADDSEVTEETASDGILLNYLVVDKPYVEFGEMQSIVVSIGDDDIEIDSAVLNFHRESDDSTYEAAASVIDGDALQFEIEYSEESGIGVYILDAVAFVTGGILYTIELSDAGIEASYGVETLVETAADAEVVKDTDDDAETADEDTGSADDTYSEDDTDSGEADADEEISVDDIDISIVTFDEDGNQTSANSIEEALSEQADDSDSEDAITTYSSSENVVVVLDPGHDAAHAGASANGLKEEELTLKIAQYCKEELETYSGVTVYMTRDTEDCPYSGTTSTVCNKNRVIYAAGVGADVYVSIHLNSATSTSANGAEVYYPNSNYNSSVGSEGAALAAAVLEQLVALGLTSRGTKIRNSEDGSTYSDGSLADYYGVIKNSKLYGFPAIIVEHAFLTNSSDVSTYLSTESGLQSLGVADATGIASYFGLVKGASSDDSSTVYDGVDYSAVYDYDYYINRYADLKAAFGSDQTAALKHFVTYGMKEGRQASEDFNVTIYKSNYYDLQKAFGDDLPSYYLHYINYGKAEGRNATSYIYTFIMNSPTTTVQQMVAYYNSKASYPSYYSSSDAPTITDFCQIYYDECVAEGVDPAVAFCQSMYETGWLKFGGTVSITAYNFCGLGAVSSSTTSYATFSTVRLGIRAHVQHLKAYASTDSLNNECVDPRFSYVTRGSAIYVEWLGQQENPNGLGWASSAGYGYAIVNLMTALYAQSVSYPSGCTYYFKNSITSGDADYIAVYGKSTDEVLVGDWNGDGVDTLCVRRGNTYYFKNSISEGSADIEIDYGRSTDEVLVGDWNGDGIDTLCVRRGSNYYFSNSISAGTADVSVDYGGDSDEALAGDWNGDGTDTLCVRSGNQFSIKYSISGGSPDKTISYGRSTDEVYVGDWDGDGIDTLCVRR